MIKNYRVDIKPLEPYTLGTEQGSKFKNTKSYGKESYIIASQTIPDQTTILGTLRYIALVKAGMLKTDFKYTQDEQEKMARLIGTESFSFDKTKQTFGVIDSVSCLFLRDDEGSVWIRNPLCNREKKTGFNSYVMSQPIVTSRGMIALPVGKYDANKKKMIGGYDAKKGSGGGFIRLKDKKIIQEYELFEKTLIVGNRTMQQKTEDADNVNNKKNIDGFFKREVVAFTDKCKDYAFSLYVRAEEETFPKKTIAFMGRKKSTFSFEFIECEDDDLVTQVKNSFQNIDTECFLALSDCFGIETNNEQNSAFYIAALKKIRNIEMVSYDMNEKYINRCKKVEKQYNLFQAGSTFMMEPKFSLSKELNEKLKKYGYNCIVELGGK